MFSIVVRLALALLVVAAPSIAVAGQAPSAPQDRSRQRSNMIEAAEYLLHADDSMACDPQNALSLARQALATLANARETDPITVDAVGEQRAQANLKIAAATRRIADLDTASKSARDYLKDARVQTATTTLSAVDAGHCYAGHKDVRAQIDQQTVAAKRLVEEGDRILSARPKEALKKYQEATKENSEAPALSGRISGAQRAIEASIVRHPLPWRRAYVQVNFPIFAYAPPVDGSFPQTIYGRTATVNYTKTTTPFFGHVDIGGAARISKAFGVGVAFTQTERNLSADLYGSIPARTSTAFRSFSNVLTTSEHEDSIHVEVRGQFGTKAGEAAIFAGPSFVEVRDGLTAVAVTELTATGNGAFVVSASPTPAERRIGINFGVDFSGFPTKVVGFGGGIRYIYSRNQSAGAASDHRQSLLVMAGLRIRL